MTSDNQIFINGIDYTERNTSFRFHEVLNSMSEFECDLSDVATSDWTNIKEGNKVALKRDQQPIFEGRIEHIEYVSDGFVTITGSDRSAILRDQKFDRIQFTDEANTTILGKVLSKNNDDRTPYIMEKGSNYSYGNLSIRSEHDNKLKLAAGLADYGNCDWHAGGIRDDFDSHDSSNWGSLPSGWTVSGGTLNPDLTLGDNLTFSGTGTVYGYLKIKAKINSTSNTGGAYDLGFYTDGNNSVFIVIVGSGGAPGPWTIGLATKSGGTETLNHPATSITNNTYATIELLWAANSAKLYVDGVLQSTSTTNVPSTAGVPRISFREFYGSGSGFGFTANIDSFYVMGESVDRFNIQSFLGSQTSKQTYELSGASQNANVVSRTKATDEIVNFVTGLGYGDGSNQLKTSAFASSPTYTTLAEDVEAEYVSDSSTMGLYHLNETPDGATGIAALDSTSNQNHSTAVTGTTIIDGQFGKCRKFNGTSDYISLGSGMNIVGTNKLTMECWIWVNAIGVAQTIIENVSTGGSRTIAEMTLNTSGQILFRVHCGVTQTIGPTAALTAKRWYHVACVYDGANMYIYVDGVVTNSVARTGNFSLFDGAAPNKWTIGAFDNGSVSSYFDGYIDEVRISSSARSAFPQNIHLTTFVPSDSVMCHYHFDESSGLFQDSSGRNYHATTFNGTYTTGKFGNCGQMGIDIYARVPVAAINNLAVGTIECWVYFDTLTGNAGRNMGIVDRWMAFGDLRLDKVAHDDATNANKFYFTLNNGTTVLYSTSAATAGTWYHLAVTWDGVNWKMYINGTLDNSLASAVTLANQPSYYLYFGRFGNYDQTEVLKGKIDEVMVSKVAKTTFTTASAYSNQTYAPDFAASGFINIMDETINYTSIDGNFWLHGVKRGAVPTFPHTSDTDTRGLFHLDESIGSVYDASSYGNDGFDQNTTLVTGLQGSCRSFNGTNAYVGIYYDSSYSFGAIASSYSIEGWFKTSSTGSQQRLLEKGTIGANIPFLIGKTSGEKMFFQIYDGTFAPTATSNRSVSDGAWHYFICQRDVVADTLKIFIDGNLDVTTTDTTTGSCTNVDALIIGRGSAAEWFNGQIDEVRLSLSLRYPSDNRVTTHPKGAYVQQFVGPTQINAGSGTTMSSYGLKEEKISNLDIMNTDALQLAVTKELLARKDLVETYELEVSEPIVEIKDVLLGDKVTVIDNSTNISNALLRVVGREFVFDESALEYAKFMLSNSRLNFVDALQKDRKEVQPVTSFMQGATNILAYSFDANVRTDLPLYAGFSIPDDTIAINKVTVSWIAQNYEEKANTVPSGGGGWGTTSFTSGSYFNLNNMTSAGNTTHTEYIFATASGRITASPTTPAQLLFRLYNVTDSVSIISSTVNYNAVNDDVDMTLFAAYDCYGKNIQLQVAPSSAPTVTVAAASTLTTAIFTRSYLASSATSYSLQICNSPKGVDPSTWIWEPSTGISVTGNLTDYDISKYIRGKGPKGIKISATAGSGTKTSRIVGFIQPILFIESKNAYNYQVV